MVAANKLVHLLEAFSTPWFLFSSPNNHHLVFFLLEVFNNIIQYQFDGNSYYVRHVSITVNEMILKGNANLIYTIIRKRQVFYQLANLPTDHASIAKSMNNRKGKQTEKSVPDIKSPTENRKDIMEGIVALK